MKFKAVIILYLSAALFAYEPHFMKDPAVSPDGTKVCFSYVKDLWSVPFEGGIAKRLTSVKGDDSNPDYSPDGKFIAFNSDRDGSGGVYIMPAEGGAAKKILTGDYTVVDWFADSETILLTKYQSFAGNKMYKIRIDGSDLTDMNSIGYPYGDLSKDNDKFVFSLRGDPYREKMKGSQNGCIYIYDIKSGSYSLIVDSPLTERYPVFSKTGKGIYFAQSDGKSFQICLLEQYEIGNNEPKTIKLTDFEVWSARDISIARTNDRMAYEYFDGLWTTDPDLKETRKLDIEIGEDVFGPETVYENNVSSADKFIPSSKGDWVLFKYKFDLFAVPFEGGDIKRITKDSNGIEDFVVMNDNETIYFTSLVNGCPRLFKKSVKADTEAEMVAWGIDKYILSLQVKKGTLFVFYSTDETPYRKLAFKDKAKDTYSEIVTDRYVENAEISRDGRYIFYSTAEPGLWNMDVFIYDTLSKSREIIYSHSGWLWDLRLDPKEEFLFFNKEGGIFRADLKKLTEFHFDKDKWKDIFEKKDKKKDTKGSGEKSEFTKIDLKNTEKLIINRPGDNNIISLTKDQNIYYINRFEEKTSLRKTDYQMKNDELITEIAGGKADGILMSDSASAVFYSQGGKIKAFELSSKKIKDTPFEIKYSFNKKEIFKKVFDEAHFVFKKWFYDPDMHGTNWDGLASLYSQYLKYVTDGETFKGIIEEMIGELNSSHTGYYPKDEPEIKNIPIAKTGADFDYTTRLKKGLAVRKVYDNSVLKTVHTIERGDILLSIDDVEITPDTDVPALFRNKVGDRIKLTFLKKDKKKVQVSIKGLDNDNEMIYETWVNERKEMVGRLSGDQIGYVHIQGMSHGPLNKFMEDLYTSNFNKKALIIDVRFNGGGYTHDELIELLTKKQYAFTTTRINGAKKLKAPYDIWDKPSALLINRYSFSDAEIFPALYREFGLGKIIGTPTSGDVIGTGPYELIDGSSMRLPRTGWYNKEGVNMEGNGVQPDILVDPTLEQIINDEEPELKKAVELLMGEIR